MRDSRPTGDLGCPPKGARSGGRSTRKKALTARNHRSVPAVLEDQISFFENAPARSMAFERPLWFIASSISTLSILDQA